MHYEPIQGDLELSAERQEDKQKNDQTRRKSSVNVFEERLNLTTAGDIYDSRLLYFDLALGLGLTQQRLSSDDESDTFNGSFEEYSASVSLFGEKPYPMSFYGSKSENLVSRQFLGPIRNENENKGMSLSLQSKQWPMRFRYNESESTQDSLSSVTSGGDFFQRGEKRFEYSLSHDFSKLSHLSFDFDQSKVTSKTISSQASTTTDRYSLVHNQIFGKDEQNRLGSSFTFTDQSGQATSENLHFTERLNLQHTDTFSTNYSFRFSDSKQELTRNKTTQSRAAFRHRLYDSLTTTGNIFVNNTDSGNDTETKRKGGGLNFNYTKENPWGVLRSSYSANVVMVQRISPGGVEPIQREPHIVPSGSFRQVQLNRTGIIRSSIQVLDDQDIRFQEGDDYRIIQSGGRTFLELFIPPRAGAQMPNFTSGQAFFVTYSFVVEPKREEDILRQRFRISQKFDNGLSVYYSLQRQDEDLSSNVTTLIPDEFRSDTYGIGYSKGNLGFLAEYNEVDSTTLPSETTLFEGTYSWPIDGATAAVLRVRNEWNKFGEPDLRDLEIFEVGCEINSELTERTSVAFEFEYFDEDDSKFGPTDGLQFNTNLLYNYRQLSLITGMEFDLLEREKDEDTSTFWYIRLRRVF
ncbi:MAG: hypothetical protein ACYST9_03095 [Planctomycetota bacterium]|jgi:hypothetical protein